MHEPEPLPVAPRKTPAELARDWRIEQLLAAGYPVAAAEKLAEQRDVDLHVALDLVASGCPPATAAEILG